MFYKHWVTENLPCDAYAKHTHNTYEMIWFLDGDATHVVEDRIYKLKKGDLVLIRPSQYHFIRIDSISRYERYNIQFDPIADHVEGIDLLPEGIEVISLEDAPIIESLFEKGDYYQSCSSEDIFAKVFSHLLSELFYYIYLIPQSKVQKGERLSGVISGALQYINENLCTIESIAELAERLFVSESYLFRLFKKELHQTPKKYIREKRLLLAQKMILAGEKPTEVCKRCGFLEYTTFYRSYLSFFGVAPSEKIGGK